MKLREICAVRAGLALRTGIKHQEHGVLALQSGDFSSTGELQAPSTRIAPESVAGRHVLQPGDVLFRSRGPYNTAWVVQETLREAAVAIMPLFVITPNPMTVDSGYLAWLLSQPSAARHFEREGSGTSIRVINVQVLEELEVHLPPLHIQREAALLAATLGEELALAQELATHRHLLAQLKLSQFIDSLDPHTDTSAKGHTVD